ncbi:MAG: hypothetical protein J5I93_11270 [Pirellulaceae bacterium]|nr:hypothetical protein [Pirellulaceae bacterium]
MAYDDQKFQAEPPAPRRSNWTPILLGCLGVVLLVVLICGGVVWYVTTNIKRIAADTIRNGIVSAVNDSELSAEDKQKIIVQVDRVVDDFKAGKITLEDLGRIAEELGESPIMGAAFIFFAEEKYVKVSGLTDEEKLAARRTLERAARGVHEGLLSTDDFEESMQIVMTTGPNGEQQMKERLTDEEVRQFLASVKQKADDAGVPDEEFKIDIGETMRQAIDRALQGDPANP